LITLTASVNYAPNCYPSAGYSPANWGANQPAAIATNVRSSAAWGTDGWQLIFRDVLEYYLDQTSGQPSPFIVSFGEARPNVDNANCGEMLLFEGGSYINQIYITHLSPPTNSSFLYSKAGTSTLPVTSGTATFGAPFGKIINDKWADVVALLPNSSASITLSTGSKIFTGLDAAAEAANYTNVAKRRIVAKIYRQGNPAAYMVGRVTAYGGTSITVDVYYTTPGGGTFNDWMIQLYYAPQTVSSCAVILPGGGGGGGGFA
jgi:hypothetical protein